MFRKTLLVTLPFMTALSGVAVAAEDSSAVTFHRDVVPVLQKHCQTCHRPGQAVPGS